MVRPSEMGQTVVRDDAWRREHLSAYRQSQLATAPTEPAPEAQGVVEVMTALAQAVAEVEAEAGDDVEGMVCCDNCSHLYSLAKGTVLAGYTVCPSCARSKRATLLALTGKRHEDGRDRYARRKALKAAAAFEMGEVDDGSGDRKSKGRQDNHRQDSRRNARR